MSKSPSDHPDPNQRAHELVQQTTRRCQRQAENRCADRPKRPPNRRDR